MIVQELVAECARVARAYFNERAHALTTLGSPPTVLISFRGSPSAESSLFLHGAERAE